MEWFEELEAAIRDEGVRVEERLTLLDRLREPEGFERLREELDGGLERLESAARALRREARRR